MAKFHFNPNTLQYEMLKVKTRSKMINFFIFTILVMGLSFFVYKLTDDVVPRPKLTKLLAERQQLLYELQLANQEVEQYHEHLGRIAHNDDQLYRVFFEVEPVPSTKRSAGTGGSQLYKDYLNQPFSNLLIEANMNLDEVTRSLVIQSKSFDEVIDLARNKEAHMAAKPSIQPLSLKELTRFGSAFGMRMHPIKKQYLHHDGIDLTAPMNTSIYATADGVVIQAQYTTGGYGKKIMIDHGYGYKTLYGHCNKIMVKKGQKVKRGEVIGLVGNTGLSTRSHLHYEVWINNRPVDPINYYANDLSPEEFEKMINLLAKADPSFDIN